MWSRLVKISVPIHESNASKMKVNNPHAKMQGHVNSHNRLRRSSSSFSSSDRSLSPNISSVLAASASSPISDACDLETMLWNVNDCCCACSMDTKNSDVACLWPLFFVHTHPRSHTHPTLAVSRIQGFSLLPGKLLSYSHPPPFPSACSTRLLLFSTNKLGRNFERCRPFGKDDRMRSLARLNGIALNHFRAREIKVQRVNFVVRFLGTLSRVGLWLRFG